MTASRNSTRRKRGLAFAALAASICAGCATTPPPPVDPLEPLPRLPASLPDDADLAARDAARALLVGDGDGLDDQVARLESLDAASRERGEPASGLLPYALDARNALIEDRREWRAAQRDLLERDDVDAALRSRLEAEVADDPLELASARVRDARVRRWGGYANAVSQSVGTGVSNPTMLPLRIAQALIRVGLRAHLEDELTEPERQALDHWKRFADEHPDAEEAADVIGRIEAAQVRWLETQRDQSMRRARSALEAGDPHLATAFTERALRYLPDDEDAREFLIEAKSRRARADAAQAVSLRSAGVGSSAGGTERQLLTALWLPDADLSAAAEAVLAAEPDGPLADEASYVKAMVAAEADAEDASWKMLERLASNDDASSNMARHARALATSLDQNPYGAFEAARGRAAGDRYRWLLFGPLAGGARDRDLPRPVEWLVEIPALTGIVWGLPERILQFPFMVSQRRSPGVLARRYLERHPDGAHAADVRGWLLAYEQKRGNHVGAYQLAESAAELVDDAERDELREAAASQALEVAQGERRRDVRIRLLQQAAREFAGTEAGHEAGLAVREAFDDFAPQRIRVSRGFLDENAAVAGPEGLAIRRALLDGDAGNGEIHPDGVTLLGGRIIELAFIAPSGDEDDPPEVQRQRISSERLKRVIAQLEESSLHAIRTDRDLTPEPDADRDTFFEHARLGTATRPDLRAEASSTYTYLGVKERFGAVRGRESILPVELVLQGSFSDFTLGAFPRIRLPKRTPDAVLYR